MSIRYRLPDELGGHECKVRQRHAVSWGGEAADPDAATVDVQIRGERLSFVVPLDWLTEVKPPLPPEPTELGYYLATELSGKVEIFERRQAYWWKLTANLLPRGVCSWKDIHDDTRLTFVRLVPDPLAELVELPAKFGRISVDTQSGLVRIHDKGINGRATYGDFGPANAREFARAVWTAANQAEAIGS